MNIRALLLAAGLGTRLRPITDATPKCLVEIDGRPLLDYWIELLFEGGIRDILVNLHHLPHAVTSYIERCAYPVRISTVYEERLLGTAGTLRKNRPFFGEDPAMLIHADNLSCFDMRAFVDAYANRPRGVEITTMTFTTDDPGSCGIIELDSFGIVRALHEKVADPPGNLANAAVYILAPAVLDFLETRPDVSDFSTQVLPSFLGRMNTYHNTMYHRDIGTLPSLLKARSEYRSRCRDTEAGSTRLPAS